MPDATLTALAKQAAHVLRTTCGGTHWLGLESDDLLAEGWLAQATGLHPYHGMRRAAMAWHGGRGALRLVQWDITLVRDAHVVEQEPSAEDSLLERAQDLIAQLSPMRRAVLTAIYAEGRTVADTAARLDLPAATVHRARYRGIEQLRAWAGRPSAALQTSRRASRAWAARNHDRMRANDAAYTARRAAKAAA